MQKAWKTVPIPAILQLKTQKKNDPEYGPALTACGVVEKCIQKITGCSNTGNISVTNKGGKKSTTRATIAGVQFVRESSQPLL